MHRPDRAASWRCDEDVVDVGVRWIVLSSPDPFPRLPADGAELADPRAAMIVLAADEHGVFPGRRRCTEEPDRKRETDRMRRGAAERVAFIPRLRQILREDRSLRVRHPDASPDVDDALEGARGIDAVM